MVKKLSEQNPKATCITTDYDKEACKDLERLIKNRRRSCGHNVPTVKADRTMDPRKAEYYVPLFFFDKAGTNHF